MVKKITKTVFVTSTGDEYATEQAAIAHEVGIEFERWYLGSDGTAMWCDSTRVPHYSVF